MEILLPAVALIALMWLRPFRYMAMALAAGVFLYEGAPVTHLAVEPQLVIAMAVLALTLGVLVELWVVSGKTEE